MAGEGDAERLVVLLEARVRDFEKNMAKASGTAGRDFNKMRTSSKTATAAMERDMLRSTNAINRALAATSTRVGGFGKSMTAGFIAPLAGLLTLTAGINGTRAALDKFGDIADRSMEAGLDPEYFQGVGHAAKMAGVDFDTFSSSMVTFAKNAGLAAENKGRMVSQLKALNPALLESIQNATTQEQRLRLAADALNEKTDAAQRAALAAVLFGDGGVVLAKAFEGGAAAMDAMVIKAKELGLTVDRDVIARAEEMGDRLETASEIVDLKLKVALADLGPLMADAAGWAAEFAKLMAIAYEQTKAIEDRQFLRPLQNELANTYNAMGPVKDRIAEIEAALAGGAPNGMILKLDLSEAQDKLAAMEEQAMRLLTRVTEIQGAPKPGAVTAPTATPSTPRNPSLTGGADLALLELNLPSAGKVDDVATGYHRVRAAAEASTIAIASGADAVDHLKASFDDAERMASSFTSGLIGDLMSGKTAAESLGGAFQNLGAQLIQMAADQAIKSLFSGLLGIVGGGMGSGLAGISSITGSAGGFFPGFASGTSNTGGARGQPRGVVHGQEAVIPLPNGGKVPVQLAGATGDASSTFHYAPVLNFPPGADMAVVEKMQTHLAKSEANFENRVRRVVARRGKEMW